MFLKLLNRSTVIWHGEGKTRVRANLYHSLSIDAETSLNLHPIVPGTELRVSRDEDLTPEL